MKRQREKRAILHHLNRNPLNLLNRSLFVQDVALQNVDAVPPNSEIVEIPNPKNLENNNEAITTGDDMERNRMVDPGLLNHELLDHEILI